MNLLTLAAFCEKIKMVYAFLANLPLRLKVSKASASEKALEKAGFEWVFYKD